MEAPNMANRCCRLKGTARISGTFSSTWMVCMVLSAAFLGRVQGKGASAAFICRWYCVY